MSNRNGRARNLAIFRGVSSSRRRALVVISVAALAGVGAGIGIGLAGDDDTTGAPGSLAETSAPPGADQEPATPPDDGEGKPDRGDDRLPPPEDDPQGLTPGPSGPAPESAEERAAAQAARAYVEALDDRDGGGVCRAFSPGALDSLEFPEEGPSCAATVKASLGFSGRRGLPVWEHSEMTEAVSAQVDGDEARVVATVFTEYADVREPSIEDDIIYLSRATDVWLVTKPSSTIYRAVGVADVPLSVLAPPR